MNEISKNYDIEYIRNNDILDKNNKSLLSQMTTKLDEQKKFIINNSNNNNDIDSDNTISDVDEELTINRHHENDDDDDVGGEDYYEDEEDGEEYNNNCEEEYTIEHDDDDDDDIEYDNGDDDLNENNYNEDNDDNDKIQTFLNVLSQYVTSTHDNGEREEEQQQNPESSYYICILCKIISKNSNEFISHCSEKHKLKLNENQENYYFEKNSLLKAVFVLDNKLKLKLIRERGGDEEEDDKERISLNLKIDKTLNKFDYDDNYQNSNLNIVKLLFIDDYNDLVNIISSIKNIYYNDIEPVLSNSSILNKKITSSNLSFLFNNNNRRKNENDLKINKNFLQSNKLVKKSTKSNDNYFKNNKISLKQTGFRNSSSQQIPLITTTTVSNICNLHPNGKENGIECKNCDLLLNLNKNSGSHNNNNNNINSSTMSHSRNACKKLKCPKCNWHYKYRETLDIHMKEKHTDNVSQCLYCLKQTQHPRLGRGEQYKCGYKPYRCDICDYSTTTKGNLSIHMQSDKHTNNVKEMKNGNYIPPVSSKIIIQDSSISTETNSNNKRLHDSLSSDYSNDELDEETNYKSNKLSSSSPSNNNNNNKIFYPKQQLNSTKQHSSNDKISNNKSNETSSSSVLLKTATNELNKLQNNKSTKTIIYTCQLCQHECNNQNEIENHLKESHNTKNDEIIKKLITIKTINNFDTIDSKNSTSTNNQNNNVDNNNNNNQVSDDSIKFRQYDKMSTTIVNSESKDTTTTTSINYFKCLTCNLNSMNLDSIIEHMRLNNLLLNNICLLCSKDCLNFSQLEKHIENKHSSIQHSDNTQLQLFQILMAQTAANIAVAASFASSNPQQQQQDSTPPFTPWPESLITPNNTQTSTKSFKDDYINTYFPFLNNSSTITTATTTTTTTSNPPLPSPTLVSTNSINELIETNELLNYKSKSNKENSNDVTPTSSSSSSSSSPSSSSIRGINKTTNDHLKNKSKIFSRLLMDIGLHMVKHYNDCNYKTIIEQITRGENNDSNNNNNTIINENEHHCRQQQQQQQQDNLAIIRNNNNNSRLDQIYNCTYCDKNFKEILILKTHLEEEHKIVLESKEIVDLTKKFIENMITTVFNNQPQQQQHQQIHQQQKTKSFSTASILQQQQIDEQIKLIGKSVIENDFQPLLSSNGIVTSNGIANFLNYLSAFNNENNSTMPINKIQQHQQQQLFNPLMLPYIIPSNLINSKSNDIVDKQQQQQPNVVENTTTMTTNVLQILNNNNPLKTLQPPSSPISNFSNNNNNNLDGRRRRTRISEEQLKVLREYFDINKSPSEEQIIEIARKTYLQAKVIKHWFRNTLFKERQKDKDSPYNFNNPPVTQLNLEEYEKTGIVNDKSKIMYLNDSTSQNSTDSLKPPKQQELINQVKNQEIEIKLEKREDDDNKNDRKEASFYYNSNEENSYHEILTNQKQQHEEHKDEEINRFTDDNNSNNEDTNDFYNKTNNNENENSDSSQDRFSVNMSTNQLVSNSKITITANKRPERTKFNNYQIDRLTQAFLKQRYPKDDDVAKLSKELHLKQRVITVWFQNARQKARKCGTTNESVIIQVLSKSKSGNNLDSNSTTNRNSENDYDEQYDGDYIDEMDDDEDDDVENEEVEGQEEEEDEYNVENDSNNSQNHKINDDGTQNIFTVDQNQSMIHQLQLMYKNYQESFMTNNNCGSSSLLLNNNHLNDFPVASISNRERSRSLDDRSSINNNRNDSDNGSLESDSRPNSPHNIDDFQTSAFNNDRSSADSKRLRTTILPEQQDYLMQKYQFDQNPSRKMLEEIAKEVRLKKRVVQVWFQNTRARERKGMIKITQQTINKRCIHCSMVFRARSAMESHLVMKHSEIVSRDNLNIDSYPDVEETEAQATSQKLRINSPTKSIESTSTTTSSKSNKNSTSNNSVSTIKDKQVETTKPSNSPIISTMLPPPNSTGFTPPSQDNLTNFYSSMLPQFNPFQNFTPFNPYYNQLHIASIMQQMKQQQQQQQSNSNEQPQKKMKIEINDDPETPLDLSGVGKRASPKIVDNNMKSTKIVKPEQIEINKIKTSNNNNNNDRVRKESIQSSPSLTQAKILLQHQQQQQRRIRTQMSQSQVNIMKCIFLEYKTPTMSECESLGKEINLKKRVVQVWFQNARAKEKKNPACLKADINYDYSNDKCILCNYNYSNSSIQREHLFTKNHVLKLIQYLQQNTSISLTSYLNSSNSSGNKQSEYEDFDEDVDDYDITNDDDNSSLNDYNDNNNNND